MDRNDFIEMTVVMKVKPSQALALEAMFEYWNQLSSMGSSRNVAFYADGDGDFHPDCTISYNQEPMEANENSEATRESLKEKSVVAEKDGDRTYDYDPVAWGMNEQLIDKD